MSIPQKVKPWQTGSVLAIAIACACGTFYEGTSHDAYKDVAGGPWTICQGHTQGVKPGDTATDDQCREYLQQDMGTAYAEVTRCITKPLTVSQQAAFTDAAYNLGPGVVCGSTLQKLANSGDINGACEQLVRWTHAGGKELLGLVKRREAERDLCLGGIQ